MTQEMIANILGVRRESVTEAAGKLQRGGLIEYHRGLITVLDRPGLEERVCANAIKWSKQKPSACSNPPAHDPLTPSIRVQVTHMSRGQLWL